MFDSLLKDIRYSWRVLLKRRAFTIVALVILALGIGANTAIFTLINAVILKPLPVHKPEELVLFNDRPSEGTRINDGDLAPGRWDLFSYGAYRFFREHDPSFQELSAFRSGESRVSVRRTDTQSGESERASGHLVSGNYFTVLGVNAFDAGEGLGLAPEQPDGQAVATTSIGTRDSTARSQTSAAARNAASSSCGPSKRKMSVPTFTPQARTGAYVGRASRSARFGTARCRLKEAAPSAVPSASSSNAPSPRCSTPRA